MKIYAEKLLMNGGWLNDQVVTVEDGIITAIEAGNDAPFSCKYLVPGMFDIHCHGGEGAYTLMPDEVSWSRYLMQLAGHGVTDILYGISTYTDAEGYKKALDFAVELMEKQKKGLLPGARIAGIHLEGPFLNPNRSGAMTPEAMLLPTVENFEKLFGAYKKYIKYITIAAERDGRELVQYLKKLGIKVQIGHTDASYEQAEEAFKWGVDSLCHTFNAARPIHHREPGVVTAALLNKNVYCEAICDFKHLHPATVKLIYTLKGPERMAVISDSVAVTGLPDGEHIINGKKYLIVDGTQRVKGGNTLSGGACYLDGSVKNLVSLGIPSEDVFNMVSRTPARRIGAELGEIQIGRKAHLTGFDAEFVPQLTVIENDNFSRK